MAEFITTEDQARDAAPVDGVTACPLVPSLDSLGSDLHRRPGGRW